MTCFYSLDPCTLFLSLTYYLLVTYLTFSLRLPTSEFLNMSRLLNTNKQEKKSKYTCRLFLSLSQLLQAPPPLNQEQQINQNRTDPFLKMNVEDFEITMSEKNLYIKAPSETTKTARKHR